MEEKSDIDTVDRLAVRQRPAGSPILYQKWGKLLFLHWKVPVDKLRPLIPERLAIDTHDGDAWVGITPFTMWGVRPVLLPAIPGVSDSHELNVRTYVHLEGLPGVWFFSLDASNRLAVLGARIGYRLPYYSAEMNLEQRDRTIHFSSRRTESSAPEATFEAEWTIGEPIGEASPETLAFFLVERYCLFALSGGKLYSARINHVPWLLHQAKLHHISSTMLQAAGLPEPADPPLVHYAERLAVEVWPPEQAATV